MSEICDLCKLNSPSGCARIYGESCLKEAADLISSSATNGDVVNYHAPKGTWLRLNSSQD